MGYPLGWAMIPQVLVRRERWPGGYRTKATPLVYPGQEVLPDQPVLRIARDEQKETVQSLPRLALPSVSDRPEAGGDEIFPAGLHGRVVDVTRRGGVVIESRAAVIQGAVGVGGQVVGVLSLWQAGGGRGPQPVPPGAILVIPGTVNFAMLRQALSSGVAGVIASSISVRDLEGFLRADLIQLLDSVNVEQMQAHIPPLTLLLTEGLGDFAMPANILNLLNLYKGLIVLLSGATSVRQGSFPELIISLPMEEAQNNWHPIQPDPVLTLGAQVRVCSGENEGKIGIIDYLFEQQQLFASGVRARSVRLRLEDGSLLVIPIALVERIG